MGSRISIVGVTDLDGKSVQKIMDQYEFCMSTQSDDMAATPIYYLYARPVGDFMIQKHFIDGSGYVNMMYYRGAESADPRTVFEGDLSALTFVDFWEAF
jgi:hypothetical protein